MLELAPCRITSSFNFLFKKLMGGSCKTEIEKRKGKKNPKKQGLEMTKFAISARKGWPLNRAGAVLLCPRARGVSNVQHTLNPSSLLLAVPSNFVSAAPGTGAICATSPIASWLRDDPASMQQRAMLCPVLQPHCCCERRDHGSHQPSRGTRTWPGPCALLCRWTSPGRTGLDGSSEDALCSASFGDGPHASHPTQTLVAPWL